MNTLISLWFSDIPISVISTTVPAESGDGFFLFLCDAWRTGGHWGMQAGATLPRSVCSLDPEMLQLHICSPQDALEISPGQVHPKPVSLRALGNITEQKRTVSCSCQQCGTDRLYTPVSYGM